MVRAKMRVMFVDANKLVMECMYDPEIKAEDKSFMQATPWGRLEMGIASRAPGRRWRVQFSAGQQFYLDFTPVPE